MAEGAGDVMTLISGSEWRLEDLLAEGERRDIKKEKLARELHCLWEEGKIQLSEQEPPSGFKEYLFGVRGLWFFGIPAFILAACLLIYAFPAYEMLTYSRYLMGSVFILYVPGFVVVEALYSSKKDLDELERLVLSVGLSLTLVPLLALVLAYTPWGVSLDSIFLLMSAFTVAFGLVAARRRFEQLKGGATA